MQSNVYDYIVVGAGTAGCVIASRLSEDPAVRVALIEAGGWDRNLLLKVPVLGVFATSLAQCNWDFATEGSPGLNDRTMHWAAGRGIGGSSSINGMIYSRGHSREYARWNCEGWSFDDVLPFFKKAETYAGGEDKYRGGSGPIPVRRSKPVLPITEAFIAAAFEAGFPRVDDLNADVVEGFGYWDVNIRNGVRISTATGYLKPALARPNLKVFTGVTVRRVTIEGGRACGVELAGGAIRTIRAEREVVVCAGGIGSPKLLMLSGIGPAGHLRSHGIEVALDAAEVGANLQNHPSYKVMYTCSKPVTSYSYVSPPAALAAGLEYAISSSGFMAESYVNAGGFSRTDPSHDVPDAMTVMGSGLIGRGNVGGRMRDLLPTQHGFTFGVTLGRPKSRGEVRLASTDPAARPLIFPKYFDEPEDTREMTAAIVRLREIGRMKSLREFVGTELQPGPDRLTEAAVEADIRANCSSAHHPMSTCRMGTDASSVVDPQLRVRGVDGLRVADASIMPSALCAGPHGPTIMIGERAAAFMAGGSP